VRAPVPTLKDILLDPQDLQDMQDVQPFVLTSAELPKYLVRYLGHQEGGRNRLLRLRREAKEVGAKPAIFLGRGVGGRPGPPDREVLRACGGHREGDHQYPKFETYREQIDGKFWFPTYTVANDTLHFRDESVRIRQTIRYEDYKQFKSDVKIIFGDEVKDDGKGQGKEDPKPPAKP